MNSLDLNGSKIHAIYLVEFLKIKWHDGMMTWCNAKIKEQEPKETRGDPEKYGSRLERRSRGVTPQSTQMWVLVATLRLTID